MNAIDAQYEEFLVDVIDFGVKKSDRTGTGTLSTFGHQMRFDLAVGFPLVTTKKIHTKSVIAELLWFLSGSTNVKDLQAMGCTIWDEWGREDGDLGPIYGAQWRSWPRTAEQGLAGETTPIDQISEAIRLLKEDPDSRRIIVSAWNVADLPKMALMPCHALFQFYTHEMSVGERSAYAEAERDDFKAPCGEDDDFLHAYLDDLGVPRRKLSCQLYQRSADIFLGVPFNIASYALLTHMVAQQVDMAVGDFVWTGGDCHLYSNHTEQAELQLKREPRSMPTLRFARRPDSIFDYKIEDFSFDGYDPHPAIKAPVAV